MVGNPIDLRLTENDHRNIQTPDAFIMISTAGGTTQVMVYDDPTRILVGYITVDRHAYQIERDRRFTKLNDDTWGAGNWVRCGICPLDSVGHEVYHHKDHHS